MNKKQGLTDINKLLHIAKTMECMVNEIEILRCNYCKKESYFKKLKLKLNELEVKVCGICGDCMNGYD